MATRTHDPNDIGPYRKIRLKVNGQGYYEVWWTAADRGYITRRESCRTKVCAEAEAYLDAFCADARTQARQLSHAGRTVDDLCRMWLEYVTPQGKYATGRHVLSQIRHRLGRYTVDQLTDDQFAEYAGRGISSGTARRELGALKTVLLWAAKKRLIQRADVPEIELPQAGAPRTKFLDQAQECWFWDQAMAQWSQARQTGTARTRKTAERVALFVALGLETAARRGAIYELTWDRVDFTRGNIDYRVPGRRVTKKRRVLVPISDRLLPVLRAGATHAPTDAAGAAVGRVLGDAHCLRRAFQVFARGIGMGWVTPHVLRHTWASLAAMNGVSLWDIGQVMGDTITTVERNYLHLTPGHLRAAINHKATMPAINPTAAGALP